MLWYNPTLDMDCPPWVYLSWAIGLFLYQTFDAVDGTQARRTHQSGPLGELFDHGNTGSELLEHAQLTVIQVLTRVTRVWKCFFSLPP